MPKKSPVSQFLLVVVCLCAVLVTAYPQRKPRVAVLAFSGEEGQRITDWAVVKLGESKDYTLIERDKGDLAKVIEEIEKTQKGLFDDPTKVPYGRLQGVEILVMGKVDTARVTQPRGCALLPKIVCQGKFSSQVILLVKLVKSATGEIVETVTVEAKAEGKDLGSILANGQPDEVFRKALLERATKDAVGKFVVKLQDLAKGLQIPLETAGTKPTPAPNTTPPGAPGGKGASSSLVAPPSTARTSSPGLAAGEGLVVDVEGSQVSIYLPSTTGLRPGEKWKIRRLRKEVKDPNGNVVGRLYDDLGEVTVAEVQPQMLVGSYIGTKPPLKDDSAVKVVPGVKPPTPKPRP